MKFKKYEHCWLLYDYWNDLGELMFTTEPVVILKVPKSDSGSYLILRRVGYIRLKIESTCQSVLYKSEEEAINRCNMLNNGVI